MATVRRTRLLADPPDAVWRTVGDLYQLPRWWPKVLRVEAVADGRFTEVLQTERGRDVRADWVAHRDGARRALAGEPGARGDAVREGPRRRGQGRRARAVRGRARRSRSSWSGACAASRGWAACSCGARPRCRSTRHSTRWRRRMAPGREMRHWGWGEDAHAGPPPEHGIAWLAGLLGGPLARARARRCRSRTSRPRSRACSAGPLRCCARSWARRACARTRAARVLHAAGKGYPDLVRLRAGDAAPAPDAVVFPGDAAQVRAVLDACAAADVAVVPFGGGTSVVGGVEPDRGGHKAVIALDLGRMTRLVDLDERSRLATLEPGLRGPEVEHVLRARGFTLGHYPAELRVRDRRRLGRDALGGAGVHRLRADRRPRRGRADGRAGGRPGPGAASRDGGRSGPARARRGLRGGARRPHGGDAARAPAARRRAATRRGCSRRSPRAARRSAR